MVKMAAYGVTGSDRIGGSYPESITMSIPSAAKALLFANGWNNSATMISISLKINSTWHVFICGDWHGRRCGIFVKLFWFHINSEKHR